jgi:hypothetical protein
MVRNPLRNECHDANRPFSSDLGTPACCMSSKSCRLSMTRGKIGSYCVRSRRPSRISVKIDTASGSKNSTSRRPLFVTEPGTVSTRPPSHIPHSSPNNSPFLSPVNAEIVYACARYSRARRPPRFPFRFARWISARISSTVNARHPVPCAWCACLKLRVGSRSALTRPSSMHHRKNALSHARWLLYVFPLFPSSTSPER